MQRFRSVAIRSRRASGLQESGYLCWKLFRSGVCPAGLAFLTEGVRREHGIKNVSRGDDASLVMDGLPGRAGLFGRLHQLSTIGLAKADLREYELARSSTMPAFAGKLESAEIADLVAYLLTLKGIR